MKVFVTGGSGFVGREIIQQLITENHSVRALVRQAAALEEFNDIETIVGDTTQPETLYEQLSDCVAVIHLVGIIREFPGKGITFKKLHIENLSIIPPSLNLSMVNSFWLISTRLTN